MAPSRRRAHVPSLHTTEQKRTMALSPRPRRHHAAGTEHVCVGKAPSRRQAGSSCANLRVGFTCLNQLLILACQCGNLLAQCLRLGLGRSEQAALRVLGLVSVRFCQHVPFLRQSVTKEKHACTSRRLQERKILGCQSRVVLALQGSCRSCRASQSRLLHEPLSLACQTLLLLEHGITKLQITRADMAE